MDVLFTILTCCGWNFSTCQHCSEGLCQSCGVDWLLVRVFQGLPEVTRGVAAASRTPTVPARDGDQTMERSPLCCHQTHGPDEADTGRTRAEHHQDVHSRTIPSRHVTHSARVCVRGQSMCVENTHSPCPTQSMCVESTHSPCPARRLGDDNVCKWHGLCH